MTSWQKKTYPKRRTISTVLAIITVLSLIAVFPQEVQAAGETPGTDAYYNARWEDAKSAAGYKGAGYSFTDHNGKTARTKTGGPWELSLNWSNNQSGSGCSLPWNGGSAQPTSTTTVIKKDGSSDNTAFEVYNAEQLRHCVVNHISFKLMKDIDLNGYMGQKWATPTGVSTAEWVADGDGHTVYNFYSDGEIFGQASELFVKNLRVKNGFINTNTGRHSFFVKLASNCKIEKCAIEDSLIYAVANDKVMQVMAGFAASCGQTIIESCYTNNFHIFIKTDRFDSCSAQIACAGNNLTIENTFAMNGSVIGNKGHNGGFVSCIYWGNTIRNCFNSNVDVYGKDSAGSFIGVLHVGTHTIENCFTSGKVEGTTELGGFIGALAPQPKAHPGKTVKVDVKNCYSTALVGVQKGTALNVGGFIGSNTCHINDGGPVGYSSKFTDCYAAGETGTTSTRSDDGRSTTDMSVAGFLGNRAQSTSDEYVNCYYDAQMTAMRNWAIGDEKDKNYAKRSDELQQAPQGKCDIKAVLTTDTDKCGTGLTSPPSGNGVGTTGTAAVNRSFTGFTDNSKWVFSEGYYPQLDVFANPTTFTNVNWLGETEMNNLVKACSLASTSTAMLKTWDEDYVGNPLPKDTYDTVRDMTAGAPLTNVTRWKSCGVTGEDTLSNGSGADTTVFGETRSVLNRDILDAGGFVVKDLYPGIDWLRAYANVDGQEASRAFRLCPKIGLDAGEPNNVVNVGSRYDHADDVRMVYTDAVRWTANVGNMTYGVYPDSPLATAQDALLGTGQYANKTALIALFATAGQDDAYKNINVGNMQRADADISNYPEATTPVGNTMNTVIMKEGSTADLSGTMGAKFNGKEDFALGDTGDYTITYYWSINDGRYIEGTKGLKVPVPEPVFTLKKRVVGEVPVGTKFTYRITCYENETSTTTIVPPMDKIKIYDNNGGLITDTASAVTINNPGSNDKYIDVTLEDGWYAEITLIHGTKVDVTETGDVSAYRVVSEVDGQETNGINNSTIIDGEKTMLYTNTTLRTLTVTKTVRGVPSGVSDMFDFSVRITEPIPGSNKMKNFIPAGGTYKVYKADGSEDTQRTITVDAANGRLIVKLGDGERLVITAVPSGGRARVLEKIDSNYNTGYIVDPDPGAQPPQEPQWERELYQEMDTDHTVAFYNVRVPRSLFITKEVPEAPAGLTDKFEFTVDIVDGQTRFIPADGTYKVYKKNASGNWVEDTTRIITKAANGQLKTELGNGEALGIEGIPKNYTAEVYEKESGRYNTFYSIDPDPNAQPTFTPMPADRVVRQLMDEDHSIAVRNVRAVKDLTIKKTVIGTGEDVFGFRLEFADANAFESIPEDANQPPKYTKGNNFITFDLQGGQEVTIPSVPVDIDLILKEIRYDGYEVKIYDVTGGIRDLIGENDTAVFRFEDSMTIEVLNNPGVLLPNTGGRNTAPYTIGGLLVVLAGVAVVIISRRRGRERRLE